MDVQACRITNADLAVYESIDGTSQELLRTPLQAICALAMQLASHSAGIACSGSCTRKSNPAVCGRKHAVARLHGVVTALVSG